MSEHTERLEREDRERKAILRFIRNSIISVTLFLMILTAGLMAGCPMYKVYTQTKEGEAELKRAQQNRQIIVESAQAKKEAAEFEKQAYITKAEGMKEAEIIRAEGMAKALQTVKEQLKTLTDEQARVLILYEWVQGLNDESSQVIYVPTESNLPILLEAGRMAKSKGKVKRAPKIEDELKRDVASEDAESSQQIKE